MAGRKYAPTETRFLEKFEKGKPGECWEWFANKNGAGYGLLWDYERRRKILAHRYSYERHHGVSLPAGIGVVIMHTCDNPACVNPAHLVAGTIRANAKDMVQKGRNRYIIPANAPPPPHRVGSAHGGAKLTEEQVQAIRAAHGSRASVAQQFGVSAAYVKHIRSGKAWKHVDGYTPPPPRLTEEQIRAIRAVPATRGSRAMLAEQYGISQDYVKSIRRCRTWKHVL